MQIFSSYKVRIAESNQKISRIFIDTLELYRRATDYFIERIREHWGSTFVQEMPEYKQIKATEELCIRTKDRPDTPYDFSREFYKFPSYLRRAAISHAYGAVSSYMTRLETWTENRHGNAPGLPRAGKICPPLYRKNMFVRDKNNNLYRARIKVFIRNTWDWIEVKLRKSDVDYLERYCSHRTEHVPTLCRQNKKVWSLAFAFSEEVELKPKKTIDQQTIVSVDLGINSACVCSAMHAFGWHYHRQALSRTAERGRLSGACSGQNTQRATSWCQENARSVGFGQRYQQGNLDKDCKVYHRSRLAALCGRDRHGIPGFPWKEISAEAAYVESPVRSGNGHGQGTPQRYAYIPCLREEYVETGI